MMICPSSRRPIGGHLHVSSDGHIELANPLCGTRLSLGPSMQCAPNSLGPCLGNHQARWRLSGRLNFCVRLAQTNSGGSLEQFTSRTRVSSLYASDATGKVWVLALHSTSYVCYAYDGPTHSVAHGCDGPTHCVAHGCDFEISLIWWSAKEE